MRRDAHIAGWQVRTGDDSADALTSCLAGLVVDDIDGVVIGLGPGVDPGVARLAVLAAGVPADVPVQVCVGADASHVALQMAAQGVLSGYHRRVLAGSLAASVGPWPPAGCTDDLDWRFSHVDDAEQTGHRLKAFPVDAESWFGRHGDAMSGDLLAVTGRGAGAVGLRVSLDEAGPRITSLAGGGADPATSAMALERSAHRALHHVQRGIDEIDLVMVSQDRAGDRAATAMAMDVAPERVIDPPELAPAVRAVAGLPVLFERLGEQGGRHAMLLSGGPDGLARATVFDTARFE